MASDGVSFSLVVATLGRAGEVDAFLRSVAESDYPLEAVEVILVDQNDGPLLDDIVARWRDRVIIDHVRAEARGPSRARNIGIAAARGEFVCFPDDDCEYLPDTLKSIEAAFARHDGYGVITCRVVDREGRDSIRRWPRKPEALSAWSFFTRYSCVSLFLRREAVQGLTFSESLGPGTAFGAYEDADVVFRALRRAKGIFTPDAAVYHPGISSVAMDFGKAYSYGLGFGGFCRANLCAPVALVYLQNLASHLVLAGLSLLRLDLPGAGRRLLAFTSRLKGFLAYEAGSQRRRNSRGRV